MIFKEVAGLLSFMESLTETLTCLGVKNLRFSCLSNCWLLSEGASYKLDFVDGILKSAEHSTIDCMAEVQSRIRSLDDD